MHKFLRLLVSCILASILLVLFLAYHHDRSGYQARADEPVTTQALNVIPDFIKGPISMQAYDGVSDDLLTAGLGQSGLQGAAPTFADPANPTAAELRRLAIYNNYRALVDVVVPGGGYGTLFGPGVGASDPEGKVAGKEYLAYADDGTGRQNVTLMVQIPNSFNPANACLVTAPSSGSRGVYGAIGTSGEWGLKKGCAVAYTDKAPAWGRIT